MRHFSIAVVVAGAAGLAQPLAAKVVKFEVVRIESPAFEGRSFGAVGTYDRFPPEVGKLPRGDETLLVHDVAVHVRHHGRHAADGEAAEQ